ncbi:MAG: L,D-transpeptidase [Alphaproteobacteria bacterium]
MSQSISRGGLLDRRGFLLGSLAGGAGLALSGCTTTTLDQPIVVAEPTPPKPNEAAWLYAATVDEGYSLPAIPVDKLDPQYLRQVVPDPTGEQPGTIVVDTSKHFLYLVQEGGKAMRYGVSLGKSGFEWTGSAVVQWKTKWPVWTPPADMIKRDPKLAKYSAENGGMPPGPQNPLGARALYLFRDGQDTMYRLHGTPHWDSIGKSASSGCVRFINQDIIDLYSRVKGKVPVHVRPSLDPAARMTAVSNRRTTTTPIDAGVPKGAEELQ